MATSICDNNASNGTTENEFIAEVQEELTVGCSLPFTVPKKEIQRIIKYSAKWFYKNYEDAVETRYFVIPSDVFKDPHFLAKRTIKMPDCIFSIYKATKTGSEGSLTGAIRSMPDFTLEKLIFQDYRDSFYVSENLMMTVAYQYWADLTQSVILYPVTFNYNRNSKLFWVGGEVDGNYDLVLECLVQLPFGYLYDEEIFFRYVVAKTKTQLARILGTFQFNFVGNVTINYDLLQSEGQDALEKIEQEIKDDEGADWFFTTNSH